MSGIAAEPMRWLWQGRLAEGMITLIDGDPGLGKSTLMLDIAARVTTGRRLPGDPSLRQPADVVVLAGEDDPNQTIRPRLDNAGADSSRVLYLDASTDAVGPSYPLSFPHDLDELDRMLDSLNPKLLLMDPVSMFFGSDVDSNNDASVRVVLSKLKAIAERHRMAVMLARHRVKSRDTDPLRTGQGSMGILGAARFGFLVARDPTDEERERVVIVPTKQNASSPAPGLAYRMESVEGSDAARIKWAGFTDIPAEALIAANRSTADLNRINDARAWLRDAMQGGETQIKDIKKKASADGFDITEVKEAIDLEGVRRKRGSVDGATYNGADTSWYYYYPGTPMGGTPPDEADHTDDAGIDPDEYCPGRSAPVPIVSDDMFSVD